MELIRIKVTNKEDIITKTTHIIDSIYPVVIKYMYDETYAILFEAIESATEQSIFIQTMIKANNIFDVSDLRSRSIFEENIAKDEAMYHTYMDTLAKLGGNPLDIYGCYFSMQEMPDKPYFITEAFRVISQKNSKFELSEFMISRDVFVRLSLYLAGLNNHLDDENIFIDTVNLVPHFEFITADRIKLDASVTVDNQVYNHYTTGKGPTEIRFNYISNKIEGKRLRNPMALSQYQVFYFNDIIIDRMIYEPNNDILYLVSGVKSSVTDKITKTRIIRLNSELYNKTNFIYNDKIYEN